MQADKYMPINCADYDYLEIACMDRYEVKVLLNDGLVSGLAIDIAGHAGEEYLVVQSADGESDKIRIDKIERITVVSRPCRFEEHEFQGFVATSDRPDR